MPRDSNGTYTLPAGQPVVSGTTISSATFNTLASDIATELTNSLDRTGDGAMTGQLKADAGTVAAPGITFDADRDCGLYRIGANNIALAANGTKILEVNGTQALGPSGTVSLPGLGFSADPDCGVYRIGANNLGVAVNGANALDIATTGTTVAVLATAPHVVVTSVPAAATTSYTDYRLTPLNTPIAGGMILTGASAAIRGGFNLASFSVADDTLRVTLNRGIVWTSTTNYEGWFVGTAGNGSNICSGWFSSSTVFFIRLTNHDGTARALSSYADNIHFVVYGKLT